MVKEAAFTAELATALAPLAKEFGLELSQPLGEAELRVPADKLLAVVQRLREDTGLGFTMLIDVTAVDWLGAEAKPATRFEVVYLLLSIRQNYRLRLKVGVAETAEGTLAVPSLTGLYPSANWYEREVWDMFGISFANHPDQRRILTDYNFQHHPLRKDFPLTGYVETVYDKASAKVIYKPVDLPQEVRDFDKSSLWQGMDENVPLGNQS